MNTTAEAEAREVARQHPTPNALLAVSYAERGVLAWTDVRDLLVRSLASAVAQVTA